MREEPSRRPKPTAPGRTLEAVSWLKIYSKKRPSQLQCSSANLARTLKGPRLGLPPPSTSHVLQKKQLSKPVYQKQIVQERRNLGEGISSRSKHVFSRYADLWYREVWVTVRKVCTVLNSKTPSYATWACACGYFL